ncbi:MAG: sigma-70 family RNA polymerase sigma factor [Pirellulaceae bacterium]|nr:sigma-70 family RNA polymerase sigma factor [Pirellulaceae bacterium]
MGSENDDRQARVVEQLFVKHVSAIRGFIEAFLPDFNRAEDVLQETFLTVAAKAGDFREGSDFLAWALTIAKFKVFESRRQPWAKVGTLSPEVIEILAASVPDDDSTDISRIFLRECMDELSPKARDAIELRYGEACKPAEIARRLQWTPESVYVTLSKSRSLLRNCIEQKIKQQGHH